MSDKICYIVGAGEDVGLYFKLRAGDCVIAADGGLDCLKRYGIAADLIIGDFDSVNTKPTQGKIIALDTDKDYTDTFEAVRQGMARGYDTFHIYCGTGGRFDHTFANIQVLGYLAREGKRGYLVGTDYVITAVAEGSIAFDAGCRGYVSVFSFTDKSAGVCIKGLKYELEDQVLSSMSPIGVSNEFVGVESKISVGEGILVVIFPRECGIDHLYHYHQN